MKKLLKHGSILLMIFPSQLKLVISHNITTIYQNLDENKMKLAWNVNYNWKEMMAEKHAHLITQLQYNL